MNFFIDKVLLFPYYITLKIRHSLYNKGVLKSKTFNVPVISVGNITVGGTGKTPHTELIIKLLQGKASPIAVVSRGYGRRGNKVVELDCETSARIGGDEPLQIKRKFPRVDVCVAKKRADGIDLLLSKERKPEAIILDDGFQHRAVTPSKSIVLVDFNRPIFKDNLLPFGRLRDLPSEIKRADIVIVTKCPGELDLWEIEQWRKSLKLNAEQNLFFTKIEHKELKALFSEGDNHYLYSKEAILCTGVANDTPLVYHLCDTYNIKVHKQFGDHHRYRKSDIKKFEKISKKYPRAIFITTEKDAVKLRELSMSDSLKKKFFFAPMEIQFSGNGEEKRFVELL